MLWDGGVFVRYDDSKTLVLDWAKKKDGSGEDSQ